MHCLVENLIICQVRDDTDVTEQFQMSQTPVALVVSQQENNYKYVDILRDWYRMSTK